MSDYNHAYPQPIDLDDLEQQVRDAIWHRKTSGFEFVDDKDGYRRWIGAGSTAYRLTTHHTEIILALIGMLRAAHSEV